VDRVDGGHAACLTVRIEDFSWGAAAYEVAAVLPVVVGNEPGVDLGAELVCNKATGMRCSLLRPPRHVWQRPRPH
jgi:hypothetical protein